MEVPRLQVAVKVANIDSNEKIITMDRSCFKVNIFGIGVKAKL